MAFLLSDDAAYINRESIMIDGVDAARLPTLVCARLQQAEPGRLGRSVRGISYAEKQAR